MHTAIYVFTYFCTRLNFLLSLCIEFVFSTQLGKVNSHVHNSLDTILYEILLVHVLHVQYLSRNEIFIYKTFGLATAKSS